MLEDLYHASSKTNFLNSIYTTSQKVIKIV